MYLHISLEFSLGFFSIKSVAHARWPPPHGLTASQGRMSQSPYYIQCLHSVAHRTSPVISACMDQLQHILVSQQLLPVFPDAPRQHRERGSQGSYSGAIDCTQFIVSLLGGAYTVIR